MKWDILQALIQLEISMKDLMAHGSKRKLMIIIIIISVLNAVVVRNIKKAITVRIAEGRCRKEKNDECVF